MSSGLLCKLGVFFVQQSKVGVATRGAQVTKRTLVSLVVAVSVSVSDYKCIVTQRPEQDLCLEFESLYNNKITLCWAGLQLMFRYL